MIMKVLVRHWPRIQDTTRHYITKICFVELFKVQVKRGSFNVFHNVYNEDHGDGDNEMKLTFLYRKKPKCKTKNVKLLFF